VTYTTASDISGVLCKRLRLARATFVWRVPIRIIRWIIIIRRRRVLLKIYTASAGRGRAFYFWARKDVVDGCSVSASSTARPRRRNNNNNRRRRLVGAGRVAVVCRVPRSDFGDNTRAEPDIHYSVFQYNIVRAVLSNLLNENVNNLKKNYYNIGNIFQISRSLTVFRRYHEIALAPVFAVHIIRIINILL